MAEMSFPLENTDYGAADAQLWFATRTSGVYSDDDLMVSAAGGMNVLVSPGIAWLKYSDFGGLVYANTQELALSVQTSDANFDRYDRVVVRYDVIANTVSLQMLRGTASASPAAPAITRNASVYEISIARIFVGKGVTAITASDVSDERLNEDVCGLMRDGVTRIPTDGISAQANALMDTLRARLDEIEGDAAWMLRSVYDADGNGEIDILAGGHGGTIKNVGRSMAVVKPYAFDAGIDGVTNYSLYTESTGGRWIDGLPIYRKVFEFGAITPGATAQLPLELGGENLLTGTRAFSGEWRNNAYWTVDGAYNGLTVRTYAGTWNGIAQAVYVEPGVYTFSGWVKGANGASVNAYGTHDGSAAFAPTGVVLGAAGEEFVRLSYTFEVTAAGYVRPRFENIVEGGQLWVCGLKLEKGEAPTAWIPAEADGDAAETPTLLGTVVSLRGMAKYDNAVSTVVPLPINPGAENRTVALYINDSGTDPVICVAAGAIVNIQSGFIVIEYTMKE